MAKGKRLPVVLPTRPDEKPNGSKERLTGSPEGYGDLAERTRIGTGRVPSFMKDEAVRRALAADAEIEKEIEADSDEEVANIENVLKELEDEPTGGHSFANGASIPFPYKGVDTVNYATCSKPKKDENRGCPVYMHCPLRDRGPFLLAYLNKRARNQIRHITCVDFLKTNMVFQPWIVLLPGINWEGTLYADYERWPDGSKAELGPGKPKPPITLTATKSMLPKELFPTEELMVEYQRLRRRGEIKQWQSQ